MNNPHEITQKNTQFGNANNHRFTTPLRKAFKRLHVVRRKPSVASTRPFSDFSNVPVASVRETTILDGKLAPPPAPRPSRLASPAAPPSPVSPLPPSASRSGNLLTIRSREINPSESLGSLQAPLMSEDTIPESSSPVASLPCGDLFRLGLTPIQSAHSIADSECPVFAPALQPVQRISSVNMVDLAEDVDMVDVVNLDLDSTGQAITPTPSSRNTSIQWLPSLAPKRKTVPNNLSTTAVFEGGHLSERRRSTFMSKLVGNAWGLAGLGLASMNGGHRRTQSAVPLTSIREPEKETMGSLPSIPIGKSSIERAVFGLESMASTTSRISTSHRHSLVNGLAPANSTLRMTGSKSARAMEDLDPETEDTLEVKIVPRPKKKRRSSATDNLRLSTAASLSPVRVTRAMAARQAEVESNTPMRVTRSASKRLAELANSPSGKPASGSPYYLYADTIETLYTFLAFIFSHGIDSKLTIIDKQLRRRWTRNPKKVSPVRLGESALLPARARNAKSGAQCKTPGTSDGGNKANSQKRPSDDLLTGIHHMSLESSEQHPDRHTILSTLDCMNDFAEMEVNDQSISQSGINVPHSPYTSTFDMECSKRDEEVRFSTDRIEEDTEMAAI
ncbi:hypothetical protein RhiXN_10033 [Rhizoctonia solani]|uniref:Uncharacterized protein n=1 Tax=Rhizoctonia solani TaxID=456999 RepID=A0A8H8P1V7_9AGAM|nr:uncharacterized protein RhiXN_10033 [Rhizoctonia solani]QRW22446.1 hypothetical protein RhiXN_10033 [Rhizoctonia solani]